MMERRGATHDIDELQASMLRSLASVHRLGILHLLGAGPFEVNEIARELGLNQAAASQHLAAMRSVGLVESVRDGRTVNYRLADPPDSRRVRAHAGGSRAAALAAGRPGRRRV